MNVCIYHDKCIDGTMSAAVFLSQFPDSITFSLNYSYSEENLYDILKSVNHEDIVYILDFSLNTISDYKFLLDKVKRVINIDHHIGAYEKLQVIKEMFFDKFEYVYDVKESGASLTWKYFYEEEPPESIELVKDRDIWEWKHGHKTKWFNNYLFLYTNQPEVYKERFLFDTKETMFKGEAIERYTNHLIEDFIGSAIPIKIQIGDYIVSMYNVNWLQSEIGNILSLKSNEVVGLFYIIGDRVSLSFRSTDTCSVSALDLAKSLGGGGHRNAAGAGISLTEFINKIKELS